jgi:DNA-binding MarR family transcriptional regulator
VRPTPEGLRLLAEAGARVAAQDADLRSRLGPRDTAGLLALLDRLEQAVPE